VFFFNDRLARDDGAKDLEICGSTPAAYRAQKSKQDPFQTEANAINYFSDSLGEKA
jgi:hypothetical protein